MPASVSVFMAACVSRAITGSVSRYQGGDLVRAECETIGGMRSDPDLVSRRMLKALSADVVDDEMATDAAGRSRLAGGGGARAAA